MRTPPPGDYLKGLREISDEFGLLLVYDEVQCGMGRTGKLFAHEWDGVAPDVMAIAKALGNGFPIGACLATERAAIGMVAGSHGSTFGGNPLAMAAGNAVLDMMLGRRASSRTSRRTARLLRGRLEGWSRPIRGCSPNCAAPGLLLGIRCVVPAGEIVTKLRGNGLLDPDRRRERAAHPAAADRRRERDRRGARPDAQGRAGVAGVAPPERSHDRRAAGRPFRRATSSTSTASTPATLQGHPRHRGRASRTAAATGRSPARRWR